MRETNLGNRAVVLQQGVERNGAEGDGRRTAEQNLTPEAAGLFR